MKNRHYELFAETASGRRAQTLLIGHTVTPEQIFVTVLAEVTQVLPYLVDGCTYTTETLCGPDVWSAWLTAEHRVAGMCMAYLVRNHVIALFRHRTLRGGGTARYRTDLQPAPLPKIKRVVVGAPVAQFTR